MAIRKRAGVVALGICAVVLMGRIDLAAQEPAKPGMTTTPDAANAPAKKKQDPSRRVPNYFGQIGLSNDQRATIYGLQAKHQEKIEALEKEIAAQKAAMLAGCENVLTDIQKKLLDNLRQGATETVKPADVTKAAK